MTYFNVVRHRDCYHLLKSGFFDAIGDEISSSFLGLLDYSQDNYSTSNNMSVAYYD